ncbi:hypothetical protein C2G38_2314491 [Gigaspora rosea]|uniref:Uncharacterized protein n=1 Tax=Gigaspora rosea TaxID=44941 RepID=A0A397V460_9GLOM|nr:hypothetical protein C2G38_2314491 [Gigaspora rosea]
MSSFFRASIFQYALFLFFLMNISITTINADSSSNSTQQSSSSIATGDIGLGFGLSALGACASAIGAFTPFVDNLFPLLPFWKDFRITRSKGFLAGSFGLLLEYF